MFQEELQTEFKDSVDLFNRGVEEVYLQEIGAAIRQVSDVAKE